MDAHRPFGVMTKMLITCVHQGFELYGSDRSFVETVSALRKMFPDADIDVVLPRSGPIVEVLKDKATRITIEPLWILRRKDLPRLVMTGIITLPVAILKAVRRIRRSDIVYVNTSVVIDYMMASRLCPGRSVIHVHEIPAGTILRVLRSLVRFSGADIIFNSRATRNAFALPATQTARVIYNGLAAPETFEPKTYDGSRRMRLIMLGRYSRIKGQEVLIEAVAQLPAHLRPQVRIVGGAFEDEGRERRLAAMVAEAGLSACVELMPFTPDPTPLYRWADVVAVPSRLPESLGRVAIEAMAFGRPPIASAIGGLPEVVDDGRTGWLVQPDSAANLSTILRNVIEHPDAWSTFPASGRARYENTFSPPAFEAALHDMIHKVLDKTTARRRRRLPALPRPETAA